MLDKKSEKAISAVHNISADIIWDISVKTEHIWLSDFCLYLNMAVKYTAHKKFMHGFACGGFGFDPYGVIISTGRCQKSLVYKLAK